MTRSLVLLALLAAACGSEPPSETTVFERPPTPRVDASDLLAKFQCARCHELPADVTPAPLVASCVTCHQQIHAGTFTAQGKPVEEALLAQWRTRITNLRWVPSLAFADRLRRDWVRAYLLAPHDIRPGLPSQMPRLPITAAEAERIAAHLVPDANEAGALQGDAARGAQLYRDKACGTCHRFEGAAIDDPSRLGSDAAAIALAPDLRHSRDRMVPANIAKWLVAPRGAMPALGLSADEASALTAFIVTTPLAPPPLAVKAERLPILARKVTWDEVEARVFRDTCWHCHSEPDFARGDGGPGNSGGFGFSGRGLDLSSYASISAGSLDDAGERRSVFARLPDGTPRLIAHLLARHVEVAGGTVPGVRGMPFGLPPVPLDAIQLVDTWITNGRPR